MMSDAGEEDEEWTQFRLEVEIENTVKERLWSLENGLLL